MDEREAPSLGAVIRAHRERLGMTRAELSRESNVSVSYLAKIERGLSVKPSPATIRAIDGALALTGTDALAASRVLAQDTGAGARPGQVAAGAIYPDGAGHVQLDLDELGPAAMVVFTPDLHILSSNARYRALLPGVTEHANAGQWLFGDVRARMAHVRWEREAARIVWWMRQHSADEVDALVSELSVYPDFVRLWRDPLLPVASATVPVVMRSPEGGADVELDTALYRQVASPDATRYLHVLIPRTTPAPTPSAGPAASRRGRR